MLLMMTITGCAASQNQTLATQLQFRVGDLERELDAKEQEIGYLKDEVKKLTYEVDNLRTQIKPEPTAQRMTKGSIPQAADSEGIIRVPVSSEKVQLALKNAGYYEGAVDGKIGSGTKAAISRFQREHNIKSDGIVGKQTWTLLKDYLE